MLKEERHQQILEALSRSQRVFTLELSQHLQVSEDTIRRDLKELAEIGKLRKVHGGAIPAENFPSRYEEREVFAQETKIQLAEKALTLLREGQVLLFDGGTTNLELARRVPADLRLTVFTNSLPVAEAFAGKPGSELILLGGRLLRNPRVTAGPEVVSALAGLRADLCFLGARSLHPQIGVSELDWDETLVKRAMAAAALETAVLAIEEKFGTAQPYIVCGPGRISFLLSPLPRRDPRLRPFQELGVECLSP